LLIYNLLNKYRKYGHRKNRLDKVDWIAYYNREMLKQLNKDLKFFSGIQWPKSYYDVTRESRPIITINMLKCYLPTNN
jgi:hypothetical protein